MPHRFEQALAELQTRGLLREPLEVEPLDRGRARIGGKEVVVLCSNDYLGLARAPELAKAAGLAAERWGTGAGASRLISGTYEPHRRAEKDLAGLVGAEDSVLFMSGYQANLGAITSAVGEGDWVISDALNHASLIDGCRLSRATVRVVPHLDLDAMEAALRERPPGANAWLISEALFSMDGDEADLAGLASLARRNDAGLLVDEAHSLGVFGKRGAGLCAEAGITPDMLVGTLGKAFGSSGAFVAGAQATTKWIVNRARSFIYTTAVAPPVAAAASAATQIVLASDERRTKVLELAAMARQLLAAADIRVGGRGPILPVPIGDDTRAMAISRSLLEQGFFVQGIRPPTVPRGTARLRLTVSAAHDPDDVSRACMALVQTLRNCPI